MTQMRSNGNSLVSISRLGSYDDFNLVLRAMRQALAPLGGMEAFVKPGQKVLLKPNLVAPSAPELAVTTHPAIVKAVARLVKECGGICTLGDGPGVGSTFTAAKTSGLADAAAEEGAELLDFTECAIFSNPENRVLKQIPLAKQLAETDVIITLPKLKTHCQMAFTGALKNQYGLVPGAAKGQYHFRFQNRDVLSDLMIDINRTAKPALAIMDAVVGMEGPGPSGGTPRKIGAVIAGSDLAAVDTVALSIIGLTVEEVPVSMAARRANFGETRLENIDIAGTRSEELAIKDYKLVSAPLNIMRILPLPAFMLRWIRRQVAPAPSINRDKCIKCKRCENGCPVHPAAIHPLAKNGRQVDDSTCIRCYCCHEFCPVKAIDLKKSLLAKIINLEKTAGFCSKILGFILAPWRKKRRHR